MVMVMVIAAKSDMAFAPGPTMAFSLEERRRGVGPIPREYDTKDT